MSDWANKKVKRLNSESLKIAEPLHLFIVGGAGAEKSYLIKPWTTLLTYYFNIYLETPGKRKVLLLSLTGVVALNLGWAAIHVGLGIYPNVKSYTLGKLSEALKGKLRSGYSEIVATITDEISKVSNVSKNATYS